MRYQGGKARSAKHIVPILREIRGDVYYVEPFLGGANIFHLMDGPKEGSDADEDVCILWDAVSKGWQPPDVDIDDNEYNELRRSDPSPLRSLVAFCTSWGGKKWGGFAREGDRDFYKEGRHTVLKQADGIRGMKILHRSYLEIDADQLYEERGASLVYCDPPYAGTLGYKSGSFDSGQFWDWVRVMSRRHAVVVSECTAPDDFTSIFSRERKQGIDLKIVTERLFVFRGVGVVASGKKLTKKLARLRERKLNPKLPKYAVQESILASKIANYYLKKVKARSIYHMPWDRDRDVEDQRVFAQFIQVARIIRGTYKHPPKIDWRDFVRAQFEMWNGPKNTVPQPSMLHSEGAFARYTSWVELRTADEDRIVQYKKLPPKERYKPEDKYLARLAEAQGVSEKRMLIRACTDFTEKYLKYKGVWEVVKDDYTKWKKGC